MLNKNKLLAKVIIHLREVDGRKKGKIRKPQSTIMLGFDKDKGKWAVFGTF